MSELINNSSSVGELVSILIDEFYEGISAPEVTLGDNTMKCFVDGSYILFRCPNVEPGDYNVYYKDEQVGTLKVAGG